MNTHEKPKALIVGVGALDGLGGALCKRFADQGHVVFAAGRTKSKLDRVTQSINDSGGEAYSRLCDATSESEIVRLFSNMQAQGAGNIDLVVYNVGNSMPGYIHEMEAGYFRKAWETLCYGGFLVAREVTRHMLPAGGTLIFTGASASLRGKAGFAAFNSGKAALRTMAQALAKEYGPQGLHVGHVIIDGGIAGEKQFSRLSPGEGQDLSPEQLEKLISLEGLADAYWHLYCQKPHAWTFELDLRTSQESW